VDYPVDETIINVIDEFRADIITAYRSLLTESGSVLMEGQAADQVFAQADAILDDVCSRMLVGRRYQPGEDQLSRVIGAARAERALHPSESLRAAGFLDEAVLSTVTARLPERPGTAAAMARLAIVLHQSITDRLVTASVSYVSHLLHRLHHSHEDERRRIARELHDLVAHSMAVTLQDLELFALYRKQAPERAEAKLEAALRDLRDATNTVRALTQDLRLSAAHDGLRQALHGYLESALGDVEAGLDFRGDERLIPPAVRGELFLILREALRNAYAHASATRVQVTIEVAPSLLSATVVDDGTGFDLAPSSDTGRSTGLASMRERAQLLGGSVTITTAPGEGTRLRIDVPLARGAP
jgi:signal transduction histidine kinase